MFSERYKELIDYGHGEAVDNISNNVDYKAKKHICRIMQDFREPIQFQPNRYPYETADQAAYASLPLNQTTPLSQVLLSVQTMI